MTGWGPYEEIRILWITLDNFGELTENSCRENAGTELKHLRHGAGKQDVAQRGPLYRRDFTIEWPVNRPHTLELRGVSDRFNQFNNLVTQCHTSHLHFV
uniref:Uncharacterized protein n=1 Tax=Vespula pensylvanica TaxID=30213 RepID=A0A834NQR2_VESPE|nr:hypothetical protein H0235_012318 [Vespula pensylvanica]